MPRIAHRFLGLSLGWLLVLWGLTGVVLLFRDAIEKRRSAVPLDRPVPESGPDYDAAFASARRLHPHAKILLINLRAPIEIVLLENGRSRLMAYHPRTGEELGPLRRAGSWLDPIVRWHANFALGSPGRNAVGLLAALSLLLFLSGMVLLPRRRHRLHAAAGLLSALPLSAFAFSAILLVWARPAAPALPSVAPPPETLRAPGELIRLGEGALPGSRAVYLQYPFQPSHPVTVRLRLPGDLRDRGSHEAHLHPATGALLRLDRFSEQPFFRRLYMLLAAFHFGELGGSAGLTAAIACGLAPAVLWITGLLLWRRRKKPSPPPAPPRSR